MEPHLKKDITAVDIAMNAVNNTVGGGIFLLPAIVAAAIGVWAIYAYILCALIIICVLLCFAYEGSNTNQSGGAYTYVKESFGEFPAFLISMLSWFGAGVLADAAIANGMANILSKSFPVFEKFEIRFLLFALIFGGYAIINIRGVKYGAAIVRLNTTIKLIPLGVLILGGLFFIEPSHYAGILSIPPLGNIGEASLILFFAFQGSESALNIGGELKNPSKTAPRGILIGVGIIVLIYILIQLVVQGLMGSELSAYEKQPLAYAAERFMGHSGFLLLSIAAVWSIFSNLGSSPLLFPRIIYATAVHKDLPSALARVHSKYQTPYIAIAFYGILTFVMAISGGFRQLAVISSAAILLMYLTVTLACMKNIWQKKFSEFKMPLGLVTPIVALIIILYFLSNLNQNEIMYTAIFILASSMIYLAIHILDKKK